MAKIKEDLPKPLSRNEEFLNYLCGREVDINGLPIPRSRIEEYLEYLCHNGGIGVGGGTGGLTQAQVQDMINELLKNALFDEATKILSFEKEDGTIIEVDLSSLANVSWNDLEYASKYSLINLMNYNEKVTGYSYRANRDVYQIDNDWSVFFLDVQVGKQYTVYRKQDDNSRYIFNDSIGGRKLDATTVNTKYPSDEYVGTSFTVPNTPAGISKVAIQFNHNQNTIKDIMVFEGIINRIDGFVPYIDRKSIQIEKEVSLEFDGTGTDLKSQTIHSAIIEVNNKIPKKTSNKIFDAGDNIWNAVYFRIPSLLRTKQGNLLATSDIRYNTSNDQSFIDIGCVRSVDNGNTWEYKIAMENNRVDTNRSRVMDSTMLQTRTGKIILLAGGWNTNSENWTTYNGMPDADWNPYIVVSRDDGVNWSEKVSLKDASKCANQPQGTVAWLGGVGTGIEMENGTLIFPIQICYFRNVTNGAGSSKVTKAGLIYSTDDGETWTMSSNFVDGTENMIVEVNGSLIMNARNNTARASYITSDLGTTWETYEPLHGKILNRNHGCQGSFIAFDTINGHRVGLISTPKNFNNNYTRDNITIYMIDFDNASDGIKELLIPYPYAGNSAGAGYSSLCFGLTKEGQRKLDIIYEDNGSISHKDITFLLSEIEDIISQSVSNTSWADLDHVEVIKPFVNLYNKVDTTKISNTGAFTSNGGIGEGTQWSRIVIPIESGKSYHICSKRSKTNNTPANILGSSDFVYFQTDSDRFDTTTRVHSDRITSTTRMNGKNIITFTPPISATHVGFNLNTGGFTDAEIEFMVWESSQPMPSDYVSDKIVKSIKIDGSKVDMSFVSTTGLSANTIREALDELNGYLANNTVPTVNYSIGEIKMFAFDLGESTEIGGKTWLRCEGQTVNRDESGSILTFFTQDAKQSSITLPVSEEGKNIYVCVG